MESLFETNDDWIVERSGIHSRRAAAGPFADTTPAHPLDGVGTTATLAIEAGRRALTRAGVAADQIEMLMLCTTSPDQAMPATSCAVAAALGITGGALDLNAACAGFSYGLILANGLLSGAPGKVLLIGAETLTRITNWEDRSNAFLFGDGAGAVVLESVAGPGSLLGSDVGVDGTLVELLYADHGGGMAMRGPEVFRRAVRATSDSARTALCGPGSTRRTSPCSCPTRPTVASWKRWPSGSGSTRTGWPRSWSGPATPARPPSRWRSSTRSSTTASPPVTSSCWPASVPA